MHVGLLFIGILCEYLQSGSELTTGEAGLITINGSVEAIGRVCRQNAFAELNLKREVIRSITHVKPREIGRNGGTWDDWPVGAIKNEAMTDIGCQGL